MKIDWSKVIDKCVNIIIPILVIILTTLLIIAIFTPYKNEVENDNSKLLRKLQEVQTSQTLNTVLIMGNIDLNK